MKQPHRIPAIILALALCLCPIAAALAEGVTFGETLWHVQDSHIWLEEAVPLADGGYLLVGGLYDDPMWISSSGRSIAPAAWQYDAEHELVRQFAAPVEATAYFTQGVALPGGRFAFTCTFWTQTDAKTLSLHHTSLMLFAADGTLDTTIELEGTALALYVQGDTLCVAIPEVLDLEAGIKEPRVLVYDLQGKLLERKAYTLGHAWAFFDHVRPVPGGLLVGGTTGPLENLSFIAWLSEDTGVSIWNHTVHGTGMMHLLDCRVSASGEVAALLRRGQNDYSVQKISSGGDILIDTALDVADDAMPLDILQTEHGLLAIGVINPGDISQRHQFATLIGEDGASITTFNSSIYQPTGLLSLADGRVYLYGIEPVDAVQAVALTQLQIEGK